MKTIKQCLQQKDKDQYIWTDLKKKTFITEASIYGFEPTHYVITHFVLI